MMMMKTLALVLSLGWLGPAAASVGLIGLQAERALSRKLAHKLVREGWQRHPQARQCTGELPIRGLGASPLGGLTQLRHTWIEVGGQSFGMPYTLRHTYFGGPAVIRAPDPFAAKGLHGVECAPLFTRAEDRAFEKRLACVSREATRDDLPLVLRYHVFQENCLAAVRFLAECAGGRLSRVPNLGIGGKFSRKRRAKLEATCKELRAQCE